MARRPVLCVGSHDEMGSCVRWRCVHCLLESGRGVCACTIHTHIPYGAKRHTIQKRSQQGQFGWTDRRCACAAPAPAPAGPPPAAAPGGDMSLSEYTVQCLRRRPPCGVAQAVASWTSTHRDRTQTTSKKQCEGPLIRAINNSVVFTHRHVLPLQRQHRVRQRGRLRRRHEARPRGSGVGRARGRHAMWIGLSAV